MAKLKYTDNAASLLTVAVLNTDVPASLVLTSGTGAKFPALSAGDWFPLLVIKAATLAYEEMRATARSGDTITATRAQGGTTALTFDIGDVVYLGSTESFIDEFLMTEDAQGGKPHWLGLVSGTDTLTAGATPAITAYAAGQLFTFQAEADNTTAVTINIDSVGAERIIDNNDAELTAGMLKAEGVYQIQYDGADFRLQTTPAPALASTTVAGLFRLASTAEVLAGTVTDAAVTPLTYARARAGEMVMWPSTAAVPVGWLECNGQNFTSTTYPDLAALLGTTWGTPGAGLTTTPNFSRRVPMGAGGSGTATIGNTVGNTGGAESVNLAHTHTQQGTFTTSVNSSNIGDDNEAPETTAAKDHTHTVTISGQTASSLTTTSLIQPAAIVKFIIKAK